MSALDKNKIFFGLIHYILSEQSNVDWILKTSLVNFTGINSTVDNKKYKQNSLTNDIIDYIYQVKPYHVAFEQFIEKYSSEQDDVNILSTDLNNIEMNIRFDAITSEVDEQGSMNEYDYMDTHMANRLWYFKNADLKNIYGNDEEIKKYIKDFMNCHFKGITVDGSDFDIDKSGYEAFLYDSTLYDVPTLSSDYCLVDYTEKLQYPYTKEFIKVGLKSILINSSTTLLKENLTIYSDYDNERKEIKEFTIKDNIVTFFSEIRQYEKITIVNTINKIRNGFVYVAHPFVESNEGTNVTKFMPLDSNLFPIPQGQLDSRKLTVSIEYPNGTRIPTTNFEKIANNIAVYNELKENYHVIITVVDYKQLYDKIYTYEDCYGQSNNTIILDGDKFLRPFYEKDRPSELCVSYPIHHLMVYTENSKGDVYSLYTADFKDTQHKLSISKSMTTKLTQDLNIGDRVIEVENLSKLILPYVNNNNEVIPGCIIINSEIIEFFEYEQGDGKKGILKSIRRGAKGSYLAEKHNKGDKIYTYNPQTIVDCSSSIINSSFYVNENTPNKFKIPGIFREANRVTVFKKSFIKLMSDITYSGTYFNLSSNNVVLPGEVILNSELKCDTIHRNQIIGLKIGNIDYQIKIDNDSTLDEFIKKVNNNSTLNKIFVAKNIDNKVQFIAIEGKPIKVYNVEGEPLQELMGNIITSKKQNPEINMDGYNGLVINGYNVVWGNDKHSIQWLRDNPQKGGIDDIVSVINSSVAVSPFIKAFNRNGYLELVSLINEKITIENLTNIYSPTDNIKELNIDTVINTQDIMLNNNDGLNYYVDTPTKLGCIYINDDKLYFKNIEKITDGMGAYYKISNYYTNKEYKAGEAKIIPVKPEELNSKEYTIDSKDGYVSLVKEAQVGEIVIISNEK